MLLYCWSILTENQFDYKQIKLWILRISLRIFRYHQPTTLPIHKTQPTTINLTNKSTTSPTDSQPSISTTNQPHHQQIHNHQSHQQITSSTNPQTSTPHQSKHPSTINPPPSSIPPIHHQPLFSGECRLEVSVGGVAGGSVEQGNGGRPTTVTTQNLF